MASRGREKTVHGSRLSVLRGANRDSSIAPSLLDRVRSCSTSRLPATLPDFMYSGHDCIGHTVFALRLTLGRVHMGATNNCCCRSLLLGTRKDVGALEGTCISRVLHVKE